MKYTDMIMFISDIPVCRFDKYSDAYYAIELMIELLEDHFLAEDYIDNLIEEFEDYISIFDTESSEDIYILNHLSISLDFLLEECERLEYFEACSNLKYFKEKTSLCYDTE